MQANFLKGKVAESKYGYFLKKYGNSINIMLFISLILYLLLLNFLLIY